MIDHDSVCAAIDAGKHRIINVDATKLYRLSRSPSTEPYWGRRNVYRFDDPLKEYGVNYTAPQIEVAFAETLLHEKGSFQEGRWRIAQPALDERHVVTYTRPTGLLRVVDLTGVGLNLVGLDNDLSASSDYTDSSAVSRLFHGLTDLDGIYYVSRQYNIGRAVAIFERSGLLADAVSIPLIQHPDYEALLDHFEVEVIPATRPPVEEE